MVSRLWKLALVLVVLVLGLGVALILRRVPAQTAPAPLAVADLVSLEATPADELAMPIDDAARASPARVAAVKSEGERRTPVAPKAAALNEACQLRVVVLNDRTNEALPNVTVRVSPLSARQEGDVQPHAAEGVTGPDGLVRFEFPPGTRLLVAAHAAIEERKIWATTECTMNSRGPTFLEVRLVPDRRGWFRGIVLDRETLQPVLGASVKSEADPNPAVTNAGGEFVVETFYTASHRTPVRIEATGYCPAVVTPAGSLEGAVTTPRPTILLRRVATVRGVVFDAAGQPAKRADLHVAVHGPSGLCESSDLEPTIVKSEGRFEFTRLPAGLELSIDVRVGLSSIGTRIQGLVLEPGEVRDVVMHAPARVDLSGRVLGADGELLTRGRVTLTMDGFEDDATIRTDGTYSLPFVAPGKARIEVRRGGGERVAEELGTVNLEIPAGVAEWTFDVRLEPALSIAGRFLDANGNPIRGGQVHAFGVALDRWFTAIVDDDGSFCFDGLAAGEYELQGVSSDAHSRSPKRRAVAGDMAVTLQLPAQGTLVGRVVDDRDHASESCSVWIESSTSVFPLFVEPASDGSFISRSVPAGSVFVCAWTTGRSSRRVRVTVEAGREVRVPDLVLRECNATMSLVVGGLAPTADYEVWRGDELWTRGTITANADFTLDAPPGPLRIVVRAKGLADEEHVVEGHANAVTFVRVLRRP